jgi:CDP-diacylglycerol---serine O-phosphatidyltransferase
VNVTPDERRGGQDRHYRRGIYLLPSLFTIGNMFCGYAAIVHAMRGDFETAAPYIGIAFVLDSLDGSIARYTHTTSAFGVELDSLADVISFGLAPAVLAFGWGLNGLGRWGWAAGFIYVTAAALRLARFNIQSPVQLDKRYFVGMPSPAAAGVVAATVHAWPQPLTHAPEAIAAVLVTLIPASLMVSTFRFRAFKAVNFGWMRSPLPLLLFAVLIALIWTESRLALVVLSYGYLLSALVEWGITRSRARRGVLAAPPVEPRSLESPGPARFRD